MEDMTKRIIRKLQVMNDYERESQRFASAVRQDIENLWQTYSFCKQFMYLQELNGESFVRKPYSEKVKDVCKYIGIMPNEAVREGVLEFHEAFAPEKIEWFFEEASMYDIA